MIRFFGIAAGAVAGTAAVALGLVFSQSPDVSPGDGLDFSAASAGEMPAPVSVPMRDGFPLQVRRYPRGDGPLVVLVHGSGWHGLQFWRLAPVLAEHAEVLVPDLRGHGAQPGRRGDVDHIGQLEEDLADLIAVYGEERRVVLAGHSSGGGLVVRFAGGAYGGLADHAVLLAPFLNHAAPTTRPNSGGWARPMVRRIIGLTMLNAVGLRALNHLPVITFAFPARVLEGPLGETATRSYSYRLNTSYAPRSDYTRDIAALPPFLLVAGSEDEAFVAEGYEPLMSPLNAKGAYRVVPGVGHLGIVDAPETGEAMLELLRGL